ncbi:MAG: LytR C-terminal domain-containing protein [Gemmatimonadota bacterium]
MTAGHVRSGLGLLAAVGILASSAVVMRQSTEAGGVDVGPAGWEDGRVRVEVLNGGGVGGMAVRATDRLRDYGFDVVDIGNARPFDRERPSVVIDRVGRSDMAQAVAEALGIDNVQSDPDPNLYVDVSVVLGADWTFPTNSAGTDGAER